MGSTFYVLLFIMLYSVLLTFKSMDETSLVCVVTELSFTHVVDKAAEEVMSV